MLLVAPCIFHHPNLSSEAEVHLEQQSEPSWQSCQMGSAASANDDACCGRGPSQSDFPGPACVHHAQQQTAPSPYYHENFLPGFRLLPWSRPRETHTWISWPGPTIPFLPPPGKAAMLWPLYLELCIQPLPLKLITLQTVGRLSGHPHSHRNLQRKGSMRSQGWIKLQPSQSSTQSWAVPFALA